MRERLMAKPVRSVVGIQILESLLVVLGAVALGWLWPALPGYSVRGPSQSLVLVLLCLALLLTLLAVFGWWSLAGFTRRSRWRQLRLYWLPIVLLLVPFAGGIRPVPLSALGLLVVAYLATAIFEEGLWRGVMVGLLRPAGVWKAVLISSVLFGAAHLANSALRGVTLLIVAQAFGAAVQGIGFAALRLRTNTVWPLILIHSAHDLFLQMSALPIAVIEAPIATITAIYGIVLLRRPDANTSVDPGFGPALE